MDYYICLLCGYVYDPEIGDPTQCVDPNTPFAQLAPDWVCPLCYADQSEFEPIVREALPLP